MRYSFQSASSLLCCLLFFWNCCLTRFLRKLRHGRRGCVPLDVIAPPSSSVGGFHFSLCCQSFWRGSGFGSSTTCKLVLEQSSLLLIPGASYSRHIPLEQRCLNVAGERRFLQGLRKPLRHGGNRPHIAFEADRMICGRYPCCFA